MEGDVITLQDIFLFDFGMGVDEHGRFRGHLKATGVRPEVRREARRPRHPPRPGGLPARGLRPPRRRAPDDDRAAIAAGAGCAPLRSASPLLGRRCSPVARRTARPPRRTAAERVVLRAVDATDTDERRRSSSATPATPPTSTSSTVRENGDAVDADGRPTSPRPASRIDIVFVVDTSGIDRRQRRCSPRRRTRVGDARRRRCRRATERRRRHRRRRLADRRSASPPTAAALVDGHRRARRPTATARVLGRRRRGPPTLVDEPATRSPTVVLVTDGVDDSRPRRSSAPRAACSTPAPRSTSSASRTAASTRPRSRGLAGGDRRPHGRHRRRRPTSAACRRAPPRASTSSARSTFASSDDRRASRTSPSPIDDADGRRLVRRRRRRSIGADRPAPRPAGRVRRASPSSTSDLGQVPRLRRAPSPPCLLFAYGVILLVRPRQDGARRRPSSPTPRATSPSRASDDDGDQRAGPDRVPAAGRRHDRAASPSARASSTGSSSSLERADLPLRAGEALFFYVAGVRARARAAASALTQNLAGDAHRRRPRRPDPAGDRSTSWPNRQEEAVRGAAARHAAAAVGHAAGRLLDDAGRRGGVPGGRRADGQGAAPGRHRGPPRPAARGVPRGRRRAHGVSPTSPGRSWPSASSGRSAATWPSCC